MKFLLTNDDGYDAPGLAVLEQIAHAHGQCITIAPRESLSGCGHQATTHEWLETEQVGPARFAVAGTPVDCVRIGLLHLAPDADCVLSGVNDGANLGVDVFMSGTVAAAREGCWLGRRAIAISQYRAKGSSRAWNQTAEQAAAVLQALLADEHNDKCYWNVNLPDAATDVHGQKSYTPRASGDDGHLVFCPLDPNPLAVMLHQDGQRYRYHGVYQNRPRQAGSDVDVCFSGRVAVTQIAGPP